PIPVPSANRTNVLVATDFNTQTTTAPLDPAVAGSPAATLANSKLAGTYSVPTAASAALACNAGSGCTTFMSAAVGLPCGAGGLPCNAVGDILGSGLIQGASMYQVPTPNPFLPSRMIPGPWTDPLAPMSQGPWQDTGAGFAGVLQVLAFVPNPSVVGPMPATGW